jgi:hypothetical protein
MKSNIHPYYPCKINIYSNGSTYLPNVPLLTKTFTKEQISKLNLPNLLENQAISNKDMNKNRKKNNLKQDLAGLVSKVKEELKKDYFCIVPLSSTTDSIFNNHNSHRLITVRFFNKTEQNFVKGSEFLWQEKKDKKF